MGDHILAIDQGTTGTKVLIVAPDGTVAGQAYSEFEQHYPQPGWVEHDPAEIWEVSRQVALKALDAAGKDPRDIAAVGITNQRETTVMWERGSGRPIANAIVWQDRRTADVCDALRERGLEEHIRRTTGLLIDPYFSGTKVAWMLDHVDEARAAAEREELAFGTIDTWLVWKLTGGAVHATDPSNASRTLLYDIYDLSWDDRLLEELNVPAAVLPEVRPSAGDFGTTDPDAFLGIEVPVAGIAGDQQAALFAQACFDRGLAKNTYGTGSFLLMNMGTDPDPITEGPLMTVAWQVGADPVEYAAEGAIFVTGSAVQWLRDGLGIIEDAAETETLAGSLDSNDGVYFVPALTGLGAPRWDPYARGTLLGLTRGTARAHIARATLESIAYQTRDVVESVQERSGVELDELRVDGGAVVNSWLMQFQADQLGVPVVVPTITETTALGSAFLAGLATGVWDGRDDLRALWTEDRRFEPRMSRDEADAHYDRWRLAVERSTGWARER
ncbi:MAG: glycerol kinase GlpK [Actinobacteria bacterium]|nr:glycerol kinase GlpK [Actinomycetota bacterium]